MYQNIIDFVVYSPLLLTTNRAIFMLNAIHANFEIWKVITSILKAVVFYSNHDFIKIIL